MFEDLFPLLTAARTERLSVLLPVSIRPNCIAHMYLFQRSLLFTGFPTKQIPPSNNKVNGKKNSSHKEIWYAHNLQSLLRMARQAWTKFFMNVLHAWSLPQPLCIISGIYEDHTRVIFSFVPVTRKWKSKQTTGSWVGPRNESKSSLLWLFFTWTLLSGSNPSLSFLTDDKCT